VILKNVVTELWRASKVQGSKVFGRAKCKQLVACCDKFLSLLKILFGILQFFNLWKGTSKLAFVASICCFCLHSISFFEKCKCFLHLKKLKTTFVVLPTPLLVYLFSHFNPSQQHSQLISSKVTKFECIFHGKLTS